MRLISLILLLLTLAGTAAAQGDDPVSNPPGALVNVESVNLVVTNYDPIQLAVEVSGTFPSGCDLPAIVEQTRTENEIELMIYQELDPAALCPMVLVMYEDTLALEGDFDAGDYEILVNGTALQFTLTTPDIESNPPTDGAAPLIEKISLIEMEKQTLLLISGTQPDGCDLPLEITEEDQRETLAITATRSFEHDMECPDEPMPFVITYPLTEVLEDGRYQWLEVNGFRVSLPVADEAEEGAQPMRVLHTIESVEALLLESFPVQIQLQVSGWQGDGCDYPVQIEETRTGNTVTVEIFRELPPDIMCTMIAKQYTATISLTGGFEPGTYTIDVNGFVIEVKV